jgi:hypothetical protein
MKVPEKSLLDLLGEQLDPEPLSGDGYNAGVRNCFEAIKRALRTPDGVRMFAIDVGRPLVRQSFPGPEAHKLTANEYAYQLGKCTIGMELEIIEFEDITGKIDSGREKVRFDAPFT